MDKKENTILNENTIETIKNIFSEADNYTYYIKLNEIANLENDKEQKNILHLLSNVMSYYPKFDDQKQPFSPILTLTNGAHSASVDDLSEADISILFKLKDIDLPIILLARITDVLWVKKGDYEFARKAVNHYLQLSDITFDPIHWIDWTNYIKRANVIANQLGKKNPCFSSICKYIDEIIKKMTETDTSFLLLDFIELQIKNDYGDFNQYINLVDTIISNKIDCCIHGSFMEKAFYVKESLLKKMKQQYKISELYLPLGKFYENNAEKLIALNDKSILANIVSNYEQAIKIYKKYNLRKNEEDIQRKIEPLQRQYIDNLKIISTPSIDISHIVKEVEITLKNCSFEESIIHLIKNTRILKKIEIKNEIISRFSKGFLVGTLFPIVLLDKNGKKTISIPPLNFDNPEKDQEILEMHMFQEMATREGFYGVFFKIYIDYINKNNKFNLDDLDFLIKDNFIIPQDRKDIVKFGLYLGLSGNYYAAIHILAPQIENIFRELARMCGSITTTYADDFSEQAKTLSSVFELPELVSCYDEDVLFTFRGLLNEKCGSNLRNKIAHGIMDSDEGNNSISIYFLCVCLKILSWYSKELQPMVDKGIL